MQSYSVQEVKDILAQASAESKIYVGCDSTNSRKYTTFVTVVVLHIDGNKGARVFPFVERQPRIRSRKQRLMNEVHIVTGMALELTEIIPIERIEVHFDINPNPKFASSEVYKQALAYAKGQGFQYKFKPDSFAATSASDYISRKDRHSQFVNA